MSLSLNAANVLVSIAGTIAAETVTAGAGAAINGVVWVITAPPNDMAIASRFLHLLKPDDLKGNFQNG